MALENLSIVLFTWQWADIERKDANRFNADVTPTKTKNALNLLHDYLESEFAMEIQAEKIIGEYKSEELVPYASGMSLKFFDHDGQLRTLFKIQNDTTLTKWQMFVYYDSILRHEFWLYPDQIEYGDSLSDRYVSTKWVSVAKEFKEYFINKPLPEVADVGQFQHVQNGSGLLIPNCGINYLDSVFESVFNINVDVALSITGDRWKTAVGAMDGNTGARLYVPPPGNPNVTTDSQDWVGLWDSYERIYSNGETCWNYLTQTCNSMGWIHFFSFQSGQATLTVRPRNYWNYNSTVIDYADNEESGHIETKEAHDTYDHIFIFNGVMEGGDAAFTVVIQQAGTNGVDVTELLSPLKGARFISISDTLPNYRGEHFKLIRMTPALGQFILNYVLTAELNYSYHKYGSEDDHEYVILGFSNQVPFGRPVVNKGVVVRAKKERILLIAGGSNDVQMTAIDGTGNHRLFHKGVSTADNDELVFSGNYGSALFYELSGGGVFPGIVDYHRYTLTDEFKNNFRKFRKSETKFFEYIHDGVIFDIDQKIRFSTRGSFPQEWFIDRITVDPINETTKLEMHE